MTRLHNPKILLVGAGNLACVLAPALHKAGYPIAGILTRNSRSSLRRGTTLARRVHSHAFVIGTRYVEADLIWFCVPDSAIHEVALNLAKPNGAGKFWGHRSPAQKSIRQNESWHGKTVFHSSGALTSDELLPLRRLGASVASIHPLMTFVNNSEASLTAVPFAVEGDREAVRLAKGIANNLGGQPYTVRKQDKVLYHVWGTFISPLLTALLAASERIALLAGVPAKTGRQRMLPIVTQTVANFVAKGAPQAFSGPVVRGDREIVEKHLRALKKIPRMREIYLALARETTRYLPPKKRELMSKALHQSRATK